MKHTPGPWEVANVEYGPNNVTDDLCVMNGSPNFRDIASIARCYQGDRIHGMEEANAHLIAAAPDMLAMLEELEWGDFGTYCLYCKKAERNGHSAYCKLGNLLQRIKGE